MNSRRTKGSPKINKYTEVHLSLGQLLSCKLLVLLNTGKYVHRARWTLGLSCYFHNVVPTRAGGARREHWALVKKDGGFIPIQLGVTLLGTA